MGAPSARNGHSLTRNGSMPETGLDAPSRRPPTALIPFKAAPSLPRAWRHGGERGFGDPVKKHNNAALALPLSHQVRDEANRREALAREDREKRIRRDLRGNFEQQLPQMVSRHADATGTTHRKEVEAVIEQQLREEFADEVDDLVEERADLEELEQRERLEKTVADELRATHEVLRG